MNTTSTPVLGTRAATRLWLLCCSAAAALTGVSAFAQATGSISGVVTDQATNTYLVGAEVRVAGTDLATATSRDGSFTLTGVPAGEHTLQVSYAAAGVKFRF